MCLVGQRGVTGTSIGDWAASTWSISNSRQRSCWALYLAPTGRWWCLWEEELLHMLFQFSFGVEHTGLRFPAKMACAALQRSVRRRKLQMAGYSTGERSATSCILLSKGNGTVSCQEVQTQESKTIIWVSADTLIPMAVGIRDFKFRKICTQLGCM